MREEFEAYRQEETEEQMLSAELAPGEQLVWHQRPAQWARVRGAWVGRIFGVFWLAFSIFWTVGAAGSVVGIGLFGLIFPLFGLPFIAIGIWMVFFQAGSQKKRPRNTIYAVTDQRVLEVCFYGRRRTRSLPLSAVRGMDKRMEADGTGELRFATAADQYAWYGYENDRRGRQRPQPFVFYGIDADAAQRAVQQQMARVRKTGDIYGA